MTGKVSFRIALGHYLTNTNKIARYGPSTSWYYEERTRNRANLVRSWQNPENRAILVQISTDLKQNDCRGHSWTPNLAIVLPSRVLNHPLYIEKPLFLNAGILVWHHKTAPPQLIRAIQEVGCGLRKEVKFTQFLVPVSPWGFHQWFSYFFPSLWTPWAIQKSNKIFFEKFTSPSL